MHNLFEVLKKNQETLKILIMMSYVFSIYLCMSSFPKTDRKLLSLSKIIFFEGKGLSVVAIRVTFVWTYFSFEFKF